METGDPKQVAALAVVAVAALGFLATRLGGKPSASAPVAALAARRSATARRTGSLMVLRDPFSHPRLAPLAMKTGPASKPAWVPNAPSALPGEIARIPALPGVASGPLLAEAPVAVRPTPSEKSAIPAPRLTTVALEATAGATAAVAFLSVDGAESRPYHPNDRVKGAIRLLRIEDGAVALAGPKGEITLAVGDLKRL